MTSSIILRRRSLCPKSGLAKSEKPDVQGEEDAVKKRRQMRYAATPRLYPFLWGVS